MIIKVINDSTQGIVYSVTLNGGQGQVIDLSTVTAKMMVKKSIRDPDSKAIITQERVHPESNLLYFELSSDETLDLRGKYQLVLKLFYDNGAEVVLRNDTLLVI